VGLCPKATRKNFELEDQQKHKKCKGTMLSEIIASLGIRCHVPKMTLLKRHS